jgi:hypothetical protein
MTIEYPFSLAQLAQILGALENERRNPNTRRNAIKAIERNAAQIGLRPRTSSTPPTAC